MFTQDIQRFLEKPKFMNVVSRDENLQTRLIRTFGVKANLEKFELTVFIPEKDSQLLLADWQQNKRIAFAIVDPITFEAYQFKGDVLSQSSSSEEQRKFQIEYIEVLQNYMIETNGLSLEYIKSWNLWNCYPSLAITFKVDAIYCQTPGPKTGNVIQGTAK